MFPWGCPLEEPFSSTCFSGSVSQNLENTRPCSPGGGLPVSSHGQSLFSSHGAITPWPLTPGLGCPILGPQSLVSCPWSLIPDPRYRGRDGVSFLQEPLFQAELTGARGAGVCPHSESAHGCDLRTYLFPMECLPGNHSAPFSAEECKQQLLVVCHPGRHWASLRPPFSSSFRENLLAGRPPCLENNALSSLPLWRLLPSTAKVPETGGPQVGWL